MRAVTLIAESEMKQPFRAGFQTSLDRVARRGDPPWCGVVIYSAALASLSSGQLVSNASAGQEEHGRMGIGTIARAELYLDFGCPF